jgi:hypothetical protein
MIYKIVIKLFHQINCVLFSNLLHFFAKELSMGSALNCICSMDEFRDEEEEANKEGE